MARGGLKKKLPDINKITDVQQAKWAKFAFRETMREIQRNLSGKVLRRRTGRLKQDVKQQSKIEPTGFFIGVTEIHGKAWEKGFSRRSYVVSPKNKKALKFKIRRTNVFVRGSVTIPAGRFKERSFIRQGVKDSQAKLEKNLQASFEAGLREAFPRDIPIEIRI
jgi:hypothetical protein